eukprot:m.10290 g.10290  ORF g.10290 m.10290 type:complete len:492 (+) comp22140_c0_seq1:38-1513(+)
MELNPLSKECSTEKEEEEDDRLKLEPSPPLPPISMKRRVTVLHGIGLIAGGIIGSGIFFTPYNVLQLSGSTGMSMSIWILAGLMALGGGLCYCELGTSIPESGGDYVYLHRAYGPLPAFLYTWTILLVSRPAGQAAITLAFAQYLAEPFYGEGCEPDKVVLDMLGVAISILLCVVNCVSVKATVRIQTLLLFFKVMTLLGIFVLSIYWLIKGKTGSLLEGFSHTSSSAGQIGRAFYQALYAYGGWNELNFATEEIPNPSKNLPRAIISGIFLVILCYTGVNIAYFILLTREEFLGNKAIVTTIGKKLFGTAGLVTMLICVAISSLGSANVTCFSSSRTTYATSRKGQFPRFLGLLHKEKATPIPAIVMQTTLCCLYLVLGTYETLVDAFSFVAWIVYCLVYSSMYVIRYREPNLRRSYKVWFWLPGLMTLSGLYLVFAPVVEKPAYLLTLLSLIPGILVYYFTIRRETPLNCQKKAGNTLTEAAKLLCNVT